MLHICRMCLRFLEKLRVFNSTNFQHFSFKSFWSCTLGSVFFFVHLFFVIKIFKAILEEQDWKIPDSDRESRRFLTGTNRTGIEQVLTGLKGGNGQWSLFRVWAGTLGSGAVISCLVGLCVSQRHLLHQATALFEQRYASKLLTF